MFAYFTLILSEAARFFFVLKAALPPARRFTRVRSPPLLRQPFIQATLPPESSHAPFPSRLVGVRFLHLALRFGFLPHEPLARADRQ